VKEARTFLTFINDTIFSVSLQHHLLSVAYVFPLNLLVAGGSFGGYRSKITKLIQDYTCTELPKNFSAYKNSKTD